jgi:hypothetical protein
MRQSVCLRTASFILDEGPTVSTRSLLGWVLTTTRLLPSQSQTLAVLLVAAIRTERPNLAQIGRAMAELTTAKYGRAGP